MGDDVIRVNSLHNHHLLLVILLLLLLLYSPIHIYSIEVLINPAPQQRSAL
jgi:hypothetical protein